jgi:hypothetical protein
MPCIEYEFVLPDGSKRYEFIDPDNDRSIMHQISLGLKMHGAVKAHPVQASLFEQPPQGQRELHSNSDLYPPHPLRLEPRTRSESVPPRCLRSPPDSNPASNSAETTPRSEARFLFGMIWSGNALWPTRYQSAAFS